MPSVFISYRRCDTSGYAGRLYDRLAAHFTAQQVFIDVDHIDPGDDFARAINDWIRNSDVVLVLIGPQWLQVEDTQGRKRLHLDDDYVRLEIVSAMRQNKTLIPVLLGKATMPAAGALPLDLQPLSLRHALICSDERFHADVDTLIRKIDAKTRRPIWRPRWSAGADVAAGVKRLRTRLFRWGRRIAVAMAIIAAGVAALSELEFADVPMYPLGPADSPLIQQPAQLLPGSGTPAWSQGAWQNNPQYVDLATLQRKRERDQAELQRIKGNYNQQARQIIESIGR